MERCEWKDSGKQEERERERERFALGWAMCPGGGGASFPSHTPKEEEDSHLPYYRQHLCASKQEKHTMPSTRTTMFLLTVEVVSGGLEKLFASQKKPPVHAVLVPVLWCGCNLPLCLLAADGPLYPLYP